MFPNRIIHFPKITVVFTILFALFAGIFLVPSVPKVTAESAPENKEKNSAALKLNAALWRKALNIHRASILVDGHNDITTPMYDFDYDIGVASKGKYHTDLFRMKEGGITAEFFSIYVSGDYAKKGGSARRAMDLIDTVYRAVENHPDKLMLSTTVADIHKAKKQGKIAALMGIEGGHAIEDSLQSLRLFYRLGVRYMTLTHNNTNNWADAARGEKKHNGLTPFGKDVVREMNRLGMLVDVSHVADKTVSDVFEVSSAPVIASHSSCYHFSAHPRNINDDLIKGFKKNGGVIMVNFYNAFLDQSYWEASRARDVKLKPQIDALEAKYKGDEAGLDEAMKKLYAENPINLPSYTKIIDHIDHIVKLAGVDHVGIGSDFDGGITLPEGIDGAEDMPLITYELLRRGYSEQDVKKILGGNFMRVLTQTEKIAQINRRKISGDGNLRKIEKSN
jgi:membrane dipeptidase